MKARINHTLTCALAGFALASGSLHATSVFYDSFETPDIGGFTNATPTDWVGSGIDHGINDENSGRFSTPYGSQAAWINQGYLSTTTVNLSAVLTADQVYSLTFNVAKRTDLGAVYLVELWAGSTMLDSVTGIPTNTDMSDSDGLVFTPGASHASLLGETLSIRIGGTTQPQYDNVNLDVVPEPSSLALLGLGGLALLRRRR